MRDPDNFEEYIRQSNLIEGIDSPDEDKRSLRAWRWLEKQKEITPAVIMILHKKITIKQLPKTEAGQFRRVQVYVGNHVPPPHTIVEQLVFDWCMDLDIAQDPLHDDPKFMHVRFETIHPFIDGNGRTGRMLMWWHEMMRGQERTLLKADERGEYYKWFRRNSNE